jgi:hypothetical protein
MLVEKKDRVSMWHVSVEELIDLMLPFRKLKPEKHIKKYANGYELLMKAFDYFRTCDNMPINVEEQNQREARYIKKRVQRAYTMSGFCIFAGVDYSFIHKTELAEKEKDLLGLCISFDILRSIMQDNLAAQGLAGNYNAMLSARVLNATTMGSSAVTQGSVEDGGNTTIMIGTSEYFAQIDTKKSKEKGKNGDYIESEEVK